MIVNIFGALKFKSRSLLFMNSPHMLISGGPLQSKHVNIRTSTLQHFNTL